MESSPKTIKTLESMVDVIFEKMLAEDSGGFSSFLKDLQAERNITIDRIREIADEYNLPLIGSGMSREVYDLSSLGVNLVLKALNPEGDSDANQNELEYNFYQSCIQDHKEFFTQIVEPHEPGFVWILAENVVNSNSASAKTKIFNAILEKLNTTQEEVDSIVDKYYPKVPSNIFSKFFKYVMAVGGRKPNGFSEQTIGVLKSRIKKGFVSDKLVDLQDHFFILFFERSPWFRELIKAITDCNLDPTDFHAGNWGIRLNGDPVILDYGFSV